MNRTSPGPGTPPTGLDDGVPSGWTGVPVALPAGNMRLGLAGTAAAAYCAGVVVRLARLGLDPWVVTDYGVSYQRMGFIRRGLIGSVLDAVEVGPGAVDAVVVGVSIVTALTTLVMLDRLLAVVPTVGQQRFLLVAAVPVFSQIGWDLGRTDMLLLPVVIAAALLGRSGRVVWVAPLVISGLVHEHVLLWLLVLLVAGVLLGWTTPRTTAIPVIAVLVIGAVLLVAGPFEAGAQQFVARLPSWVPEVEILMPRAAPWTGSLADALSHVRAYIALGAHVSVLTLLAAVVVAVTTLRRRLSGAVAAVAVVPVLLLALVGVDYMRWAFWLLFVTGALLAVARSLPEIPRERVVPTVMVLLVLGAFGTFVPLPYWTVS